MNPTFFEQLDIRCTRALDCKEDALPRMFDEIRSAATPTKEHVVPTSFPQGRIKGIEKLRFIKRTLWGHYKPMILRPLTEGTVGRLQRRLRGRKAVTPSSDYWPIRRDLAWDYWKDHNQVVVAYDNARREYVWHDHYSYWSDLIRRLSQKVEDTTPQSVLEMGSGYGRNLIAMIKQNQRVPQWLGLDYSPIGVLATRANLERERISTSVKLICGDFRNTELPSQSVDMIYCIWSMPYGCTNSAKDIEDILIEFNRVARKRIVLVEPQFFKIFGISKAFGFWNFGTLIQILRKSGHDFSTEELPIRINPFASVHIVDINLTAPMI